MPFYINYLYVNQNLTGSQCLCPTILPRFHKINLNFEFVLMGSSQKYAYQLLAPELCQG